MDKQFLKLKSKSAKLEIEKQHSIYHYPSLRARVPRKVLEGGDIGPFRRGFLSRFARRLRPTPAVKVENLGDGLAATVLYAPMVAEKGKAYAPTQFVSCRPKPEDIDLVYNDMPYEVRILGMFAKSYDHFDKSNELVLYSVQTDPKNESDAQALPVIHFNYLKDATKASERQNSYQSIPASKSYVVGSSGVQMKTPNTDKKSEVPVTPLDIDPPSLRKKPTNSRKKRSLNVQFRLLEIDKPSKTVSDAVTGINDLGGIVSGLGFAVPFMGALNPATEIVSTLSQRALDSYARPDKVLNIDMDLNIADRLRVANGTAPAGEYLRYGYYFFLGEPVEGKLYASVRTPGNLTLMLKRCEETTDKRSHIDARTYFPLTDVSYLVVRVAEPTDTKRSNRRPIQTNHAHILEDLFKRAKPGEDEPVNVRDSLYKLGVELGVIDYDSDESDQSEKWNA